MGQDAGVLVKQLVAMKWHRSHHSDGINIDWLSFAIQ